MASTSGLRRPGPQSPPPGGDHSTAELLNTVTWVLTALSTVLVGLRLFTRVRIIRNPGRDDIAVAISSALNITGASLISVATTAGLGRHLYYLRPHQLSKSIKFVTFSQPFCVMSFALSKVAVALLLIRVVPPAFRRAVWFLYCLAGIQLLLGAVVVILEFAQCSPTRSLWDLSLPLDCWPFTILQNFLYALGGELSMEFRTVPWALLTVLQLTRSSAI
ncbi:hypothetical protein LPUS_00351 [Lasallia pustulata]|uniref:Rhodopsin domain-containing protein n=1 Tax=Lasallia pustulata TaxID=136370 RepID=A0A1W5CXG7_9LECA|nr:hypothetical protein LPUS_00351 [Lasallia pustulata]